MPYIELATSRYPLSEREIRDAHPNLTFASPFNPDGYALVFPTPQPSYSMISEYVREIYPALTDKGHYEQQWEVLALPAEQIAANQATAVQTLVRSITDATQKRLNDFAQTRNYDNTDSMAKYKDITDDEIAILPEPEQPLVRKFRAECRYFALAVAQTWAKLYNTMAEVQSGTRPMPASFSDVEPDLPVLTWPA